MPDDDDECRRKAPRSEEERQVLREALTNALKRAREHGLRGKALTDFARTYLGITPSRTYKLIRRARDSEG